MNEALKFVKLEATNLRKVTAVAAGVFPQERGEVAASFALSLLPRSVTTFVSRHLLGGVPVGSLEYFAAQNAEGKYVGTTGLYSVLGSKEAWIGWYGVDESARGHGYGKALLDWTLQEAKSRGIKTLRLWTSENPDYAKAVKLYEKKGFTRQDIEVCDPQKPEFKLMLYAKRLDGDSPPEPFKGDMREALLGASKQHIALAQEAYRRTYGSPQGRAPS